MNDNLDQLAAALNGHQVTDDTGALTEETTSDEDTAAQETNTLEETATAEKSADTTETAPNAGEDESENELAEDDKGKRYVPEGRFKEVYGKAKQLERELAEARKSSKLPAMDALPAQPTQPVDTTAALEQEMLFVTLPQFNPESGDYSPELDQLGATIYKAKGTTDAKGNFKAGITKIQAAREAVAQAKKFTSNQIAIQQEARQVKASQSDQGITKVQARGSGIPDASKMSEKEMEKFLKDNGQW